MSEPLYRVCPTCHGGTCRHTEGCEGCKDSDFIGFVPVEPCDLIDFDAAWTYHIEMWGSLTDTEDWHNHVSNIVRHALGLPLGDFTGQIEPEHYAFMAEQENQRE